MDAGSFIDYYFIKPIWDMSGYNMVNTLAYAVIAIVSVYLIYLYMQKKKIDISDEFVAGALAFTLFGSSLRVVTDSITVGKMAAMVGMQNSGFIIGQATIGSGTNAAANGLAGGATGIFAPIANALYPAILNSHILDYGYFTVTPGIYIVTATFFLSSYFVGMKLGRKYFAACLGLIGAAINLIILLPMFSNFMYAGMIIALAACAGALAYFWLKYRTFWELAPVLGHALDGAATWVAIDWFAAASGIAYSEQHVVSAGIGSATPLGFGLFFLLKVGFSMAAVWVLREEEDERMKKMALLVIMIIGFAPGLRDLLRLLAGT